MAVMRDCLNDGTRSTMLNYVLTDETIVVVGGINAWGDAPVEIWYYDVNSSATHDGETVIKPSSVMGNGRFLRLIDPVPVGVLTQFAGSTAPVGYLLCDGSAISRTTYSRLFSVLSTVYGVGDGSTTFNLPDLRQRFPMGVAASGTGNSLGATGGNIDHSHTINPPTTNTSSDGAHNHGGVTGVPSTTVQATILAGGAASTTHTHSIFSDGSHTHSVDISQFDSGNSNPPFISLNYIIKY